LRSRESLSASQRFPCGESSAGVLKVEFRVEAPEDEYPAVSQSLVDVVCVCVCVC
jgi:hypothetical protein